MYRVDFGHSFITLEQYLICIPYRMLSYWSKPNKLNTNNS